MKTPIKHDEIANVLTRKRSVEAKTHWTTFDPLKGIDIVMTKGHTGNLHSLRDTAVWFGNIKSEIAQYNILNRPNLARMDPNHQIIAGILKCFFYKTSRRFYIQT